MSWTVGSRQLTLDLGADGGQPVQTMASVKWMPYSYSGVKWGPCPIDVYYAEFERRYAHAFDDTSSSAREARGKLLYFQFYYLALYTGLSSVVMVGEVPNTTALAAPELASDAQMWQDIISNVINPLAFQSRGRDACGSGDQQDVREQAAALSFSATWPAISRTRQSAT